MLFDQPLQNVIDNRSHTFLQHCPNMGVIFIPCVKTIFSSPFGVLYNPEFLFWCHTNCLSLLVETWRKHWCIVICLFSFLSDSQLFIFTVFLFHLMNLYFFRLEFFFFYSEDCCKLVTDGLITSFLRPVSMRFHQSFMGINYADVAPY